MYITTRLPMRIQAEPILHLAFWIFYFASINANWGENWLDRSLRPETVSQYAILLFPFLFYANAFWLLPTYLKRGKWFKYVLLITGAVFFSEMFRCVIYVLFNGSELDLVTNFKTEYNSYDNVIFGRLGPAILALQFSFAYRFTIDWVRNNKQITRLQRMERKEAITPLEAPSIEYKENYCIKRKKEILVLRTVDIVYFKAQGDFVVAVDSEGRKNIINSTLSKIESEIDPDTFFRINRSELINKSYVLEFETYIKNRQKITLETVSEHLYTSNSRTPAFRKWLRK